MSHYPSDGQWLIEEARKLLEYPRLNTDVVETIFLKPEIWQAGVVEVLAAAQDLDCTIPRNSRKRHIRQAKTVRDLIGTDTIPADFSQRRKISLRLDAANAFIAQLFQRADYNEKTAAARRVARWAETLEFYAKAAYLWDTLTQVTAPGEERDAYVMRSIRNDFRASLGHDVEFKQGFIDRLSDTLGIENVDPIPDLLREHLKLELSEMKPGIKFVDGQTILIAQKIAWVMEIAMANRVSGYRQYIEPAKTLYKAVGRDDLADQVDAMLTQTALDLGEIQALGQ